MVSELDTETYKVAPKIWQIFAYALTLSNIVIVLLHIVF